MQKENLERNVEEKVVIETSKTNETSSVGLVLGIISVVVSVLWIVSLPLAILAVVFAVGGKQKERNGVATAGLILGIVGLVISVGMMTQFLENDRNMPGGFFGMQNRNIQIDEDLLGTWEWEDGTFYTYVFNRNGTGTRGSIFEIQTFRWHVPGDGQLLIHIEGYLEDWSYTISRERLTLESNQFPDVRYSYVWVD
ncbi:MAG: DUF4190 domain-containing protein [Oscillospiraceae bacterium]|nr:DUF4190 domain-containing protein [Oscillospiraceae bacterium]